MPAAIPWIAAAALAVSAYSAYEQHQTANEQKRAEKRRQSEQTAVNAQKAAQEKRQQIREERIKRAQILQQAENTGVEGSSGEVGGVGNLATRLSTNLGFNQGMLTSSQLISGYEQQAADARYQQQTWGSIFGLSSTIFGATVSGMSKTPTAPQVTNQQFSPIPAGSGSWYNA